ncbi:MAG: Rv0909 family putative TA system antitoxin [Acidimicrobiales bacterium]
MRSTYGERDRARGTAATVAWLAEELGELSQSVRKGDAGQQLHELGDVLAWLASLADQLGLSLSEAAERYRDGCPGCRSTPCGCARGAETGADSPRRGGTRVTADEAKDQGDNLIDNLKAQASGLAEKGKNLIAEHGNKVTEGIDKAADFVDEKTGGKHTDKIETAADKAKDLVDKLGADAAADEGPASTTTP